MTYALCYAEMLSSLPAVWTVMCVHVKGGSDYFFLGGKFLTELINFGHLHSIV